MLALDGFCFDVFCAKGAGREFKLIDLTLMPSLQFVRYEGLHLDEN